MFASRLKLIAIFVSIVCTNLAAAQYDDSSGIVEVPVLEEEEWDYEPRIWHHDDDNASENIELAANGSLEQSDQSSDGDTFEQIVLDLDPQRENFSRDKHYYLDNKTRTKVFNQDEQEECGQFRVDIREAIICDKTRCDKIDFEWPQYANQLVMIQTTRHGMRFHRADFSFEAKKIVNSKESSPTKIKFDLLELFKPSTTTTTTTTTTTAAPSSPTTTTAKPAETETTVTSSESTPTTPSSTITTFVPWNPSTQQKQPERQIPTFDTSQDSNTTQLVTTFRLDTKRLKQRMIGFGGALSDSTCRNIKSLSSRMARSLMEDYYGDRGLRYNIVRMSVGSSDFSTTPYTNNDASASKLRLFQSNNDDVEMNNFRLTSEDLEFKIPMARQAIATSTQELKFFSSLWSPPIWMKNNSHIVHGYLKGDVYGPYYKALAELIVKWLEAYRKQGIEFWATTVLNEPVTGKLPFIFHNSLGISKDDYVLLYKLYLGPMLRQRGFSDLKLLMLDDNKGYADNWIKTMFADQEAAKYISGFAFHWYMNDEYENLNFLEKEPFKNKFIISSEACNGFLPFQIHTLPGDWDRGMAYMYDITRMIQKNTAAWIDWNMALDLEGGPSWAQNLLDAAIIVNGARDEYYKSPMFYAIGHFSRFVERNSRRLDYIIANAKYDYPVEAVAFHTPSEYIVIVAFNANRYPVPFRIIVDRKLVKTVTLRADSFNTIIFKWKKAR